MYIYKTKLNKENFLKNAKNPLAQKYIDEINRACDKFRGTPIQALKFSKFRLYDETGERSVFQKDYFEIRRRMTMFLMRVWLYKEEDDIRELEDILWAVCDEYSWALPAHLLGILTDENIVPNRVDLFAAETAHTISEALSLCGEYIHPVVKKRCMKEIFKRVIEPFETEDNEKYGFSWEFAYSNWAAVCGGAVGMTALYLIEDGERLDKILSRTKAACNNFFDSCTDDGVCSEGVSYWMYAMQYYVGFDELLKERMGKSIVINEDKALALAKFPAVACMKNNIIIKFSDCNDTLLFFGILCKLNELYGVDIPEQSYYGNLIDRCARTCGAVRTIAWFNPKLLHSKPQKENVFLPNAQWAILTCGDMIVVGKGGSNNDPHNHNDVGSYMYINGKNIIADELGAAKYTKEYFDDDKRYSFINAGSHGHSLPIINGCVQLEGADYAADIFEESNNGLKISFADAYDKKSGIKKLNRYLYLDKKGVLVRDCFEFHKNINFVAEHIITKFDVEIQDTKKVLILKNNKPVGTVEFLSDGKIKILKDSYFMPNSSGKTSEYSAEDKKQEVTIIEFECNTDSDNMEISYIIK